VNEFRKFIENYTPVSDQEWCVIYPCFKRREVKKNEFILLEGFVCKHLYFLETGLLRYFFTKDGNEVTKFFTNAPYCFTSQASYNSKKPAKENIQALEHSIVWEITVEKSDNLFALDCWTIFARKIIQEVQFFAEEILEEIQSETAEQRYKKMVHIDALLANRIPLKHLASYLGIAPQSLSRIRKKLAEKSKKLT
jgi:CRP-like cAMP-binding protein